MKLESCISNKNHSVHSVYIPEQLQLLSPEKNNTT